MRFALTPAAICASSCGGTWSDNIPQHDTGRSPQQFFYGIYDASVTIGNKILQEFEENCAAKDQNADER